MKPKLQELADRADILDCMHRYARGMDRFDRELLRSAYHDDAIDDHVGFVGNVDDFIDWAFAYHTSQTRHQHYLTNHTVDLDGDDAHAETYYIFVGTDRESGSPLTITGGRYVDHLERRTGRWGIVARVCLVEWASESPSLLTSEALGLLAPIQTVARDHTDASYDRPLTVTRSAPGGG
ncbi:nuclear transport factor 2 family protein [Mycobacterium avium subsp. hominissuis]|uniref:nuclear transport factor 2 family protein n=1 Tax=Mycobacterium avium TaxID=1764 RepID=UPI0022AB0100|nr:nuclear transport factor 2 family protein [Mycobacterium avium]